MKKNLFDASVKDEIINRSKKLAPASERLWGSMTGAEMLRHCSEVLKGTMAVYSADKSDTLKQKIARFMMLNFLPRFPRGARTPLKVDIKKNNIFADDLQTEQELFAGLVNVFANYNGAITLFHPYFGNLNRKQWGIITWMHIDHHLRQFGV